MNEIYSNVCSGEVYYIEGPDMADKLPLAKDAEPKKQFVWANRPAVVISSDECCQEEDSVFVAFLTRKANRQSPNWYQKFSPRQVDVNFGGRPATALCSHVMMVDKLDLGRWMGTISPEELSHITAEIREGGCIDNHLQWMLYRPEPEENVPQR